jgi:XapX domain-containing protein
MKALLISFLVGLLVGVAYGVIRVKSPAPPIVALLGLLGMVLGEQGGGGFLTKKIQAKNVASFHVVSEHKDQRQRLKAQSGFQGNIRHLERPLRDADLTWMSTCYVYFYRMLTRGPTCPTTAGKPSRNCSGRC